MRIAIVVLTSCLAAACGPKSSPPPPAAPAPPVTEPADPPAGAALTDAQLDKLMRDVVAFFGTVADAAGAAGADCTKMAAGIESAVADHAELMTRAHALDEDPAAADRGEAWMEQHGAENKATFDRLFTNLGPCQEDPGVQAALEKMSGG